MNEDAVRYILEVEREASAIHDDAQRKARQMVTDAEKAADAFRGQAIEEAEKQIKQLIREAQETAAAERARILAEAEAEFDAIDKQAEAYVDRAVVYILEHVSARH